MIRLKHPPSGVGSVTTTIENKIMGLRDWFVEFVFQMLERREEAGGRFPVINGVTASKAQLELAHRLGVREKHINYLVCGYYVDIALPRQKIAIEYNGRFWHEGKEAEDLKRVKHINRCGWKVLSILTNRIPPAEFVWAEVDKLAKGRSKYRNVEY